MRATSIRQLRNAGIRRSIPRKVTTPLLRGRRGNCRAITERVHGPGDSIHESFGRGVFPGELSRAGFWSVEGFKIDRR